MQPWKPRQRVAVMLLCGMIVTVALCRYAFNRSYISDPQPLHPLKEDDLADRIDPNTADAPTLSALPLIGDKRAEDIVKFRDRYVASHPGRRAFEKPADLLLIHGIGQATINQLKPYLIFPEVSSTQPAGQ